MQHIVQLIGPAAHHEMRDASMLLHALHAQVHPRNIREYLLS